MITVKRGLKELLRTLKIKVMKDTKPFLLKNKSESVLSQILASLPLSYSRTFVIESARSKRMTHEAEARIELV